MQLELARDVLYVDCQLVFGGQNNETVSTQFFFYKQLALSNSTEILPNIKQLKNAQY